MVKLYVQQFINLDVETVNPNTRNADELACAHCHVRIPLISVEFDGRTGICREHRIDCEVNGRLETYHLDCYDIELYGRVTNRTNTRLLALQERYGDQYSIRGIIERAEDA